MEVIRTVLDPDLGMSIVDLGLIYNVKADGDTVQVEMTLTSPACPYGMVLVEAVKNALLKAEGVADVEVELVWDPPWSIARISPETRLDLGLDF